VTTLTTIDPTTMRITMVSPRIPQRVKAYNTSKMAMVLQIRYIVRTYADMYGLYWLVVSIPLKNGVRQMG
jgi:hypothetical protein